MICCGFRFYIPLLLNHGLSQSASFWLFSRRVLNIVIIGTASVGKLAHLELQYGANLHKTIFQHLAIRSF